MQTTKQLLAQIKRDIIRVGDGYGRHGTRDYRYSSHTLSGINKQMRKIVGASLHYAKVLGCTQQEILHIWEENRTYWAANYYNSIARLDKADMIFETYEDADKYFANRMYRCPACNGLSSNPTQCTTGLEMSPGKICDWKSYGFFGTLGKGFSYIVKERLLSGKGGCHHIFMPEKIK